MELATAAPPAELSPKRQIAAGSLWLGATFIVTTLTGPLLVVALVRLMSHAQYGALAFAISIVGLLAIITEFGLGSATAQIASVERVRHGDAGMKGVLRSALRIAIGAMVVSLIGYAGLLLLAKHVPTLKPTVPALICMMPIVVGAPLVGVGTGFLRANFRPRLISVATIFSSLVVAAITVLVLAIGDPSAAIVGAARSLGVCLMAAIFGLTLVVWTRQYQHQPGAVVSRGTVLRFGGAVILTGVFSVAVAQLDVFLLGIYRGSRTVAFYAPASGIATAVLGIPVVIAGFFLPVVSRAAARRDDFEVRHLYHWASRWNLVLCSPALAVLVVCPTPVMRVAFGADYGSVGDVLRVLGIGVIAQVLFGYNGVTLDAYGIPGAVAIRQVIAISISAFACLLLIPHFGMYGAAWATTGALLLANVLCAWSLFTYARILPWNRESIITIVVFGAAMACSSQIATAASDVLRTCLVAFVVGTCTLVAALVVAEKMERRAIIQQLRQLISWRIQIGRPAA